MTGDARSRLQPAEALKRVLGDDEGITMMELLPPVGRADVATKHDLHALEARMDLRFEAALCGSALSVAVPVAARPARPRS